MTLDDAWWNWFAGFLDGEGCFDVRPKNVYIIIRLRHDDRAVLEEIAQRVGGTLGCTDAGRTVWWRSSVKSLQLLVDGLDAHPLRAKKRYDYAVWREAALAKIAGDPTVEFIPRLRAVRKSRTGYT